MIISDKWISVNDKMPEHEAESHSDEVLVFHSGLTITLSFLMFGKWVDKENQGCYLSNVTHWIGLPNNPKI